MRKECHDTGCLDLARNMAMHLGLELCRPPGHDLAPLADKLVEEVQVPEVRLLKDINVAWRLGLDLYLGPVRCATHGISSHLDQVLQQKRRASRQHVRNGGSCMSSKSEDELHIFFWVRHWV